MQTKNLQIDAFCIWLRENSIYDSYYKKRHQFDKLFNKFSIVLNKFWKSHRHAHKLSIYMDDVLHLKIDSYIYKYYIWLRLRLKKFNLKKTKTSKLPRKIYTMHSICSTHIRINFKQFFNLNKNEDKNKKKIIKMNARALYKTCWKQKIKLLNWRLFVFVFSVVVRFQRWMLIWMLRSRAYMHTHTHTHTHGIICNNVPLMLCLL